MDNNTDPLRKIPTKHAPEARADIGTALKAARAKKGHTLEAVAQQTRIQKKFLDALENNRFDEFPALAYLRGFLKSYCDYLEVDFDPLWQAVNEPAKEPTPAPAPTAPTSGSSSSQPAKTPAGAEKKPEPPKAAAKPEPKPAPKPQAKKMEEPKVTSHPKPAHHAPATAAPDGHGSHGHDAHGHAAHGPAAPSGPVGPILLALILGLLGTIGFFASTSRVPAPPKAQTPAGLAARLPSERTLSLDFREEGWAQVEIDEKIVFEGKVPQGARQEWKTDKTVVLRLSKPGAVAASVAGAELKLPAPDASGVIRVEAQ